MINKIIKLNNWRGIINVIIIVATISMLSIVIYGIYSTLKMFGVIENKDEKIAVLQNVTKSYEEKNKDLVNTIKEVKKHSETSVKIITKYEEEKIKIIKKNFEIKRKIKSKEEKVKKIKTIKPKETTNNVIKIDRHKYIETGKIHINSIWIMYNDVKGVNDESNNK